MVVPFAGELVNATVGRGNEVAVIRNAAGAFLHIRLTSVTETHFIP
ncbi:hypothetical protein JOE66_000391 [Subtercola frigoramans]|uniref:Uncharacterized protein n=1 Tax=Subtercola frigoramans TaxID=120298 RepID=A0ABS2L120_9MICO|nr:hypothetical protein [Subtercola frigoramans]